MNKQRLQNIRRMQRVIVGILSIWALFLLSFLVAVYRVADNKKLKQEPYFSIEKINYLGVPFNSEG